MIQLIDQRLVALKAILVILVKTIFCRRIMMRTRAKFTRNYRLQRACHALEIRTLSVDDNINARRLCTMDYIVHVHNQKDEMQRHACNVEVKTT